MKNNISDELIPTVLNLIKNKKYDEALNQLNGLLEKKQNSNFINKMKGLIYLHKKEWVKSLQHYQKISKTEINFEISNNMGVSFYKIGKYYEASNKFSQSIKNNNTFIPAYENLCLTNKLLGNYDLAIKAKHITTTAKIAHKWEYIHDQVGYNYRLPNLNAALLCAQLEQLKLKTDRKKRLFGLFLC